MPATFAKADILFAALKDEMIFALTVPAKIQAYMSAGKPILTMINGEAKELIRSVGCGIAVDAGDAESFVEALLSLSQMSRAERENMGAKGKVFAKRYFDFELQMNLLEDILNK
jgi:glycosyltransferase involved in cell wall biosynthesis